MADEELLAEFRMRLAAIEGKSLDESLVILNQINLRMAEERYCRALAKMLPPTPPTHGLAPEERGK